MSDTTRRTKIQAMLADEPHDTFLRYSLAMEWQKEEAWDESLSCFRELMQEDPPHVPSFFMAGKLFARLERVEEARAILREGIEQARRQGDQHAAAEMAEFLMELGDQP